ncbi:MAG: iron ABC transporter permease [Candidatus Hydrogenedentes bacterium]|nr:iron ABC transporter permease [Candidatus Hydrogenedentota bacterium]
MNERPASLRVARIFAGAVIVIVALLPVVYVFAGIMGHEGKPNLGALQSVLSEPRQWILLGHSLCLAAGATIAATLLGTALGLAASNLRVPGHRYLLGAAAISFVVPQYILAMAWVDLLGSNGWLTQIAARLFGVGQLPFSMYSLPGAILVLIGAFYPVVMLTTWAAARGLDPRLDEAASLTAGPWRRLLRITLPLLLPSIFSGALFVFALVLVAFAVPDLLQVRVYPVEIYTRYVVFYEFGQAAAQALPLLLCGLAPLALWWWYVRPRMGRLRFVPGQRRHTITSRWARIVGALLSWAVVLVFTGLPLTAVFVHSLPLQTYLDTWKTAQTELANSLTVSVISATALVITGLATAYLARHSLALRSLVPTSVLPVLVSGPVVGIGLIALWNHADPRAVVYDGGAILILACAARFLFFSHHGLLAAFSDLSPKLEEAACVFGIPWYRQLTGIFVPACAPAIVAAWAIAFVFSFSEVETTVLVCPPGWTTLTVRLFSLMHYGPSRMVFALSMIIVTIIVGTGLVTVLIFRKMKQASDVRHPVR